MDRLESDTRQLQLLFGAYMHQDWDREGDDWPDLVRNFSKDSKSDLSSAAAEIERLLKNFADDDVLKHQVYRVLGCCYDPTGDLGGPTLRVWLATLAEFLRNQSQTIDR